MTLISLAYHITAEPDIWKDCFYRICRISQSDNACWRNAQTANHVHFQAAHRCSYEPSSQGRRHQMCGSSMSHWVTPACWSPGGDIKIAMRVVGADTRILQ